MSEAGAFITNDSAALSSPVRSKTHEALVR